MAYSPCKRENIEYNIDFAKACRKIEWDFCILEAYFIDFYVFDTIFGMCKMNLTQCQ